jgi:hypothetical protein
MTNIDPRVKIRPVAGQEDVIYGTSGNSTGSAFVPTTDQPNPPKVQNSPNPAIVMAPLRATNGLTFPYTPQIRWGNDNDYQSLGLVHVNSDYSYFIRQNQMNIQITGEFTAQNDREARYLLAAIHFLSSNSKMRFGSKDPNRGLPPPILILSGYGKFIFPDIPVLIKSWSVDYSNTVDNVEVNYVDPTTGEVEPYAYVPSKTSISVDLLVQKRPIDYLKDFNLDSFRNGDLFLQNKGFR